MQLGIIGGGVAGLCAAMQVKQSELGSRSHIVVFEKNAEPGGLLQSTGQQGVWWDNGTFLFGSHTHLVRLFSDLFGPAEDLGRRAWYGGKLHVYPFGLREASRAQPPSALVRSAGEYLTARARSILGARAANMDEWLRWRMTSPLLNWTHLDVGISKLQGGQPTSNLSPALGMQRLKMIDNMANPLYLLKSLFRGTREAPPHTVRDPRQAGPGQGVGLIPLRLVELCEKLGIEIRFGARVDGLTRLESGSYEITYQDQGRPGRYSATHVISTMPLDELPAIHRPTVAEPCLAAARELAFTNLQLCFYLVDKPSIANKHMVIYSFEERHQWKRLVIRALPDGKCTIAVEVDFDPRIWQPPADIVDRVAEDLSVDLGLFGRDQVLLKHSRLVPKAYPIYELGFQERASTVIEALESPRLQIAGRGGRFQYASTHSAIQTAHDAVARLLAQAVG